MKRTRTLLLLTGAVLLLVSLSATIAQQGSHSNNVGESNRGTLLAIPSKPMVIWDKNRQYLWGTIVSRDENGITVLKKADGKEYHVKWDTLDPKLVPYYKGEMTLEEYEAAMKAEAAANTAAHQKLLAEETAARKTKLEKTAPKLPRLTQEERAQLHSKYRKMSAQELQALFINNDESFLRLINRDPVFFMANGKNPESVWDLVRAMEIKPIENEKVSLRKEFESLGVRTKKQDGRTCIAYTMHNLFQYLVARNGGETPSPQALIGADPGGMPTQEQCLKTFANMNGRIPKMQGLRTLLPPLDIEILKHELRKGRPCTVTWGLPTGGQHLSLAIGFEVKDGKTTFEILDTNGVHIDGGYKMITTCIPNVSYWE